MFKRRRAASTPAPNRPPNASASLAASKAFLQNRDSNASISSAAAAAALRTHPSGPTAVGDTVTKRMVRKASISSQGSGSQQRPLLGRSPSSGSMTLRSFRSPTPNQDGPVTGPLEDAPPVPAVPKVLSGPVAVHRRASSLEPPQRSTSDGGRGRGRGHSVDGSARISLGTRHHVTRLAQVPEDGYDGRPRSVNFSRPISPATQTTPIQGGHSGWFAAPVTNTSSTFRTGPPGRPKSADGVRRYEAQNTWQSIQNAADRPVSTRRSQIPQGVEGARLASGSMGARPSGSSVPVASAHTAAGPVDPKSADAVYDPSTRTFIWKQEAMAKFRELHEEEEPPSARLVQYAPAFPDPSPAVYGKPQHSPVPFHDVKESAISPPQRPLYISTPASSNADLQHSTTPFEKPAQDPSPLPIADVRERYPTPPPEINNEEVNADTEGPLSHPKPLMDDNPDLEQAHLAVTSETGPVLARETSEDLLGLDIKPPAHANISRKLDSTLSEPVKMTSESSVSPQLAANQDGPCPRVGTPDLKVGQVGRGRGSIRSDRGSSLSPLRSAHFVEGALELPNEIRHQPPARSVSPAKSALKSSPSMSRRNSSPFANDGQVIPKGPLSEISDAVSDEGIGKKKKKSVRVSFEEPPTVAGPLVYGETPTSSRGLSQSRWSTVNHDHDFDDYMKPRPALPSFGSIRDKNRRHVDRDEPEKVTETVSSSLTASIGSIHDPVEASSDHALGYVDADDFASKKQSATHDPLPPEVTSVEGSGYYSDSDSSDISLEGVPPHNTRGAQMESSIAEPKTLKTSTNGIGSVPLKAEVPVISIQPATPNLVEKAEPLMIPPTRSATETSQGKIENQRAIIPGGWNQEDDQPTEELERGKQPVEPASPTRISFVEPPSPSRKQEPDSSDDDDSIYSDAYEDLPEPDTGAFASIDEIVESPIVAPRTGLMQSKHAPTQALRRIEAAIVESSREKATNTASSNQKESEEGSKIGQAVTTPQNSDSSSQPTMVRRQNKMGPPAIAVDPSTKPTVASRTPQLVSKSDQQPVHGQPQKSSVKKPVGGPQTNAAGESQMRRSIGGPAGRTQTMSTPEPSMRTSLPSNRPMAAGSALGLAASRHSMVPVDSTSPRGALQKRNVSAPRVASNPRSKSTEGPLRPKLDAKPLDHDSDSGASESSFQRERKQRRASRSVDAGGRYTMRRFSMRTEPDPTMRAAPIIRPMLPATATFPPPPAFRNSLRSTSAVPDTTSTKASRFSIRSLPPAGSFRNTLRKGSKVKTKPAVSSRDDESSDDDFESRSRRFQSRFADSDDEEEFQLPPGLAPVRGIPKRPGEEDGDSTDLEDEESDDEPASAPKPHSVQNGHPTGLQKSKHALLPAFESPKKTKAKRRLFGLGKKKDLTPSEESTTKTTTTNGVPSDTAASDIPPPPAHRSLTPIGEEQDAIEFSTPPTHRTPKLQRRNTPQGSRSTSDSWPLPASPATVAGGERPPTSDGVETAKHVAFKRATLSRRWSSQTVRETIASTATTATSGLAGDSKKGEEAVVGRNGKKKKFQALRRVFGLYD